MIERTLAIIKPDAWPKHGGAIITMATEAGLVPVEMKVSRFSVDGVDGAIPALYREQLWRNFYSDHTHKPFFKSLVEFMASGPSLAMVLEGEDTIARWRALMGPTDSRKASPETIRGRFGEADLRRCARGAKLGFDEHTWMESGRCAIYGCDRLQVDVEQAIANYPMWRNAVHGSDSAESAAREIKFFFGGA